MFLLMASGVLLFAVLRVQKILKRTKNVSMNVSYMMMFLAVIVMLDVLDIIIVVPALEKSWSISFYFLADVIVQILMVTIMW